MTKKILKKLQDKLQRMHPIEVLLLAVSIAVSIGISLASLMVYFTLF